MDVTDLSNVYNATNTRSITQKLQAIKNALGPKVFELLLKDILNKNKAGIDQTVRIYTVEPSGVDLNTRRDILDHNSLLTGLKKAIEWADRYNSPEETCADCNKTAADVFDRPGIGRKLCSKCYEKIVPNTKVSPDIVKVFTAGYGSPINYDESIFVEPTDDIKSISIKE